MSLLPARTLLHIVVPGQPRENNALRFSSVCVCVSAWLCRRWSVWRRLLILLDWNSKGNAFRALIPHPPHFFLPLNPFVPLQPSLRCPMFPSTTMNKISRSAPSANVHTSLERSRRAYYTSQQHGEASFAALRVLSCYRSPGLSR
jgi:hypothetical protein